MAEKKEVVWRNESSAMVFHNAFDPGSNLAFSVLLLSIADVITLRRAYFYPHQAAILTLKESLVSILLFYCQYYTVTGILVTSFFTIVTPTLRHTQLGLPSQFPRRIC